METIKSKLGFVKKTDFKNFGEFYPFYLGEHSHPTNRRLHVLGTTFVVLLLLLRVLGMFRWAILVPIVGYGFAWVGHFYFEKNKPATFKHPLWSLMGDFKLWFETVSGQRPF
jgi:hypothetical protein